MKILYSVQATGNGHISRAHQLYPYLSKWGEVDIMLSGSNATLDMDMPVKFRSRGLSLYYSQCGGLSYSKTFKNVNYFKILNDAKSLPVDKYDLVINDFDHVTALACRKKGVPSIQFGHQASFMSAYTPRPSSKSALGEWILHNYAPATRYVGLHFDKYDSFIFPPVIKDVFIENTPKDQGHITVYAPAYDEICIRKIFKEASHMDFHWFLPNITHPYKDQNIFYFPINQKYFNESLLYCHGLVTGGGFETPAEALYLKKKLITIPIYGQYEQQCNAAALRQKGILSLDYLNKETKELFLHWASSPQKLPTIHANNIEDTLTYIMN